MTNLKDNLSAVIKLLFTAVIWASTYVFASILVREIGPITVSGLRFFTGGFLLVLYLKLRHFDFSTLKDQWTNLLFLGLLSFAIGNGCTYFALQYLSSTTVSFLISFVSPLVLVMGIFWLNEKPVMLQVLGIVIALAGTVLFFYPQRIPFNNPGFIILVAGIIGFAGYTILGRHLARERKVHYLAQTAFPLLFGGGITLILGLFFEGLPVISMQSGLLLGLMILVNTLLAYILYNQAIGHMTAIQVNMILNLSPFFTAMIAFFLVGEVIHPMQIGAMLVGFAGTLLVQVGPSLMKHRDQQL